PACRPRRSRPSPVNCRKRTKKARSRSSSISATRWRLPARPSRSGIQNGTWVRKSGGKQRENSRVRGEADIPGERRADDARLPGDERRGGGGGGEETRRQG